jgi:hypothetical protein
MPTSDVGINCTRSATSKTMSRNGCDPPLERRMRAAYQWEA